MAQYYEKTFARLYISLMLAILDNFINANDEKILGEIILNICC